MAGNDKKSVRKSISGISDCPLRITLQMLFILINEPGKYNLKGLEEKLGYKLQRAITTFLEQSIFEFYSGDILLTRDNAKDILCTDSENTLSVVARSNITDQDSFKKFYALRKEYEKAESKKKNFEKIIAFNSYIIENNKERASIDRDVLQMLSEGKTSEYEYSLNGIRFYPVAVYKNLQYDREYYVALEMKKKTYRMRFFPSEYSRKCESLSTTYILLAEKYPDILVIETAREKLKTIWGPYDMDLAEAPFKVSAIIYDESCLGKLRHDISNYDHTLVENSDKTYSLDLEVLGYEAFRSWVLRYGSSIEIKEPIQLRDDLRKTYKKVRDSYS